ncbi:MAG: aspartate kinase [Candidatus Aenigmarchaeota archaeon]|nr:aspartate kinase [Candidatus Aenigmarchaeota archaeon]
MTDIVKCGGGTLDSMEKIQRIIDQWGIFDDNVVFIASANGGTTNRIKDAIRHAENGGSVDPEAVFEGFEHIYRLLPSRSRPLLDSRRDSIYNEFRRMPQNMPPRSDRNNHRSYTACRHLEGETLSAALFDGILRESGHDSEFVDLRQSPLAVSGDCHNARIDLSESRKKASAMREKNSHRIIVLPGYGGVDRDTGALKTLGRNGSDTAASGYLYSFGADRMWMITNVRGILTINDEHVGETVPQLDTDETKDAAVLAAKLPGRRAVHGIERYFIEGGMPEIYVTRWDNIGGPKTRIVYQEGQKTPVKLVAGRDMILYLIEGDIKGLQNMLYDSGMEYVVFLQEDYALLAVPDVDSDTEPYADGALNNLFSSRKRGHVSTRKYAGFSLVGAVGNGMNSLDDLENGGSVGILDRGSHAIRKRDIPIAFGHDMGKVSIGYILKRRSNDGSRDYGMEAQRALYDEFRPGKK